MRRREFIGSLIGTAIAWPVAASAQIKLWRIGWLAPNSPPEPGRPYGSILFAISETHADALFIFPNFVKGSE
jgi:hypothetical protein